MTRKQKVARTILGMFAVVSITALLVIVGYLLFVAPSRLAWMVLAAIAVWLLYLWAAYNA